MPNQPKEEWPPVIMVENAEQLQVALEEWESADLVGLDTESNSFFAYTDRLCLLQVSANGKDWIVDPIALGEDLKMIKGFLEDPEQVVIFHAAEYDLMLIKADLGAEIKGLFDTQVAMTLLGSKKTGLAALLEDYYGVCVSKKYQRSDWGKRPLSDGQLEYARTDTRFLPDVYGKLMAKLEAANMVVALEGDCLRQEQEILSPRVPNMEGWRKLKQARGLDASAKARLRALFQWRETTAQKRDVPVFRVLANDALGELARHPPKSMKDLADRKGVGWKVAKRYGDPILNALRAVEGQEIQEKPQEKVDRAERERRRIVRENKEALKNWRKKMAQSLDLPSERLMHRRHLEELASKLPRTSEELLRTIPMNDWQRETLESSLLVVLENLPAPQ
ncbi:MAG: HRDC domain-containing protein [Planctomycetota bacterium]|nr:HRDC domain-containing protein [Planctomycetota bacterium]